MPHGLRLPLESVDLLQEVAHLTAGSADASADRSYQAFDTDPRGKHSGLTNRARALVLDDVQPLLSEPSEVLDHPLQHLGCVALPGQHLVDDAHRVARSV
jgi:hypothetical protein